MDALIIVDVQNDFMPFGALPTSGGDEIVAVCNRLAGAFELVVATQDWHPPDHGSFASNHPASVAGETVSLGGIDQILWPDHCVQGLPGASFHSGLDIAPIAKVVRKGTDPCIDSYSGFFDNRHKKATGMEDYLKERGVDRVVLAGLATDYCVLYSALDARSLGLDVVVATDACRAVELSPGDGASAFNSMREAGCALNTSAEIMRALP